MSQPLQSVLPTDNSAPAKTLVASCLFIVFGGRGKEPSWAFQHGSEGQKSLRIRRLPLPANLQGISSSSQPLVLRIAPNTQLHLWLQCVIMEIPWWSLELTASSDGGSTVSTCCCAPCPPERLSLGIIHIYRETAMGSRLLTPIQLPLAAHPEALQVIPASPTLCPIAAGAMGRVFTPWGSLHCSLGQEEEPWNSCWGRSTEALWLPACPVSKTTPISGPLSPTV